MRLNNVDYRPATLDEIATAQKWSGAPHVTFYCRSCGGIGWHAKNIALSDDGSYNGTRNIFYDGRGAECACAPSELRMAIPR